MPDSGIEQLWDAIEANLKDGLKTTEELDARAGQFEVESPFSCTLRLSYKPSTVFHRIGKTNPQWAVITWSKDFSSHWKSCVEVWFKPEEEEIYLSEFFLMNQDGVCDRGKTTAADGMDLVEAIAAEGARRYLVERITLQDAWKARNNADVNSNTLMKSAKRGSWKQEGYYGRFGFRCYADENTNTRTCEKRAEYYERDYAKPRRLLRTQFIDLAF